jgi:hypothetical protein
VTTLLDGEGVADDRLGYGHNGAGAETLDRPEDDQLDHRRGDAAEGRSAEEDDDPGEEDGLSTVEVG